MGPSRGTYDHNRVPCVSMLLACQMLRHKVLGRGANSLTWTSSNFMLPQVNAVMILGSTGVLGYGIRRLSLWCRKHALFGAVACLPASQETIRSFTCHCCNLQKRVEKTSNLRTPITCEELFMKPLVVPGSNALSPFCTPLAASLFFGEGSN